MGLNIVEGFLVAGAVDLASRRRLDGEFEVTREEDAALAVIAEGMTRAGFRYRPGLLQSWGRYYEALAGLRYLQEHAA